MGGELFTIKVPDSDADKENWASHVQDAVRYFVDYAAQYEFEDEHVIDGIIAGLSQAVEEFGERMKEKRDEDH